MKNLLILTAAFLLAACAYNSPQYQDTGFPQHTPIEGQICGGMRMGQTCTAPGTYCHRDMSAQCGAADHPGTCRPIPQMCTMDYAPVCGCDDQTYGNECMANGKGVSAAYQGVCR